VKCAFITGITGQDGSYLAELLLNKGYEVHGIMRRSSSNNTTRIDHIRNKIILHYGDLSDSERIQTILKTISPDEIYNLAAQSHVKVSFDNPVYTGDITGLGTTRILEAIRGVCPHSKFYQASSSEMFGSSPPPQNENTPFAPRSPYGCAKLYSYWMTRNYRDGYNLFACNGILFNHESPRRGEEFVTKKITMGIANILFGNQRMIELGNISAKRDWGYAPEYVEIMWKMLQQKEPDDYVIGTGETHTIQDFLVKAFEYAGMIWENHVKTTDIHYRPNEVDILCADPTKAKNELGWSPKTTFNDLVKIMVDADIDNIGRD